MTITTTRENDHKAQEALGFFYYYYYFVGL